MRMFAWCMLILGLAGLAQELPPEVQARIEEGAAVHKMRTEVVKKGLLEEPSAALLAQYQQALARVEQQAVADGQLELVLAVRAERARVTEGTPPEAQHPKVDGGRAAYEERRAAIVARHQQEQATVDEAYRESLKQLRSELTKANQLDAALQVDQMVKQFGNPAFSVGGDVPKDGGLDAVFAKAALRVDFESDPIVDTLGRTQVRMVGESAAGGQRGDPRGRRGCSITPRTICRWTTSR